MLVYRSGPVPTILVLAVNTISPREGKAGRATAKLRLERVVLLMRSDEAGQDVLERRRASALSRVFRFKPTIKLHSPGPGEAQRSKRPPSRAIFTLCKITQFANPARKPSKR